jgi:hypothetical protein
MRELVDGYLSMPKAEVINRTRSAQENLKYFTYEANLLRFRDLVSG